MFSKVELFDVIYLSNNKWNPNDKGDSPYIVVGIHHNDQEVKLIPLLFDNELKNSIKLSIGSKIAKLDPNIKVVSFEFIKDCHVDEFISLNLSDKTKILSLLNSFNPNFK